MDDRTILCGEKDPPARLLDISDCNCTIISRMSIALEFSRCGWTFHFFV